jgi:hypothetical protein
MEPYSWVLIWSQKNPEAIVRKECTLYSRGLRSGFEGTEQLLNQRAAFAL